MGSKAPDIAYCCEICGMESLSVEEFRVHTHTAHVNSSEYCPFCQLGPLPPPEMASHVNHAHLEFLTPDAELNMTFIDDASPGSIGEASAAVDWIGAPPARNINNLNLAPQHNLVNGGGELNSAPPPQEHAHDQHGKGSPLRNSLKLKLANSPIIQCPLCIYSSVSAPEMEEHINRKHFDLTSPSAATATDDIYMCPLCAKSFGTATDVELHVNIEHQDVLSPAPSANSNTYPSDLVESVMSLSPDREALRKREERDFELLRAQYGMDDQGNFREQSVVNMQRAVYAGEMSVADYYERTLDLRAAESCGIDDGSSVTRTIVPRVRAMSYNSPSVALTLTCTCVDHYASSFGDRGWGCGYRNTQMLFSSMLAYTNYNERLYCIWTEHKPPRTAVPSISHLQQLIERAWSMGFDTQGGEQLGSKLVNTRKWIGATEVITLLSYLRIKCQLLDFHRSTGPNGTHPDMFNWVLDYFENTNKAEFIPPLYLQHQGHSRTIMGIEVENDGSLVMLILDPSHSPQQMAQFGDTNAPEGALRLLRKTEPSMKARQYQIVAVVGLMNSDEEYQDSKIICGTRVPLDR